MIRRTLLCALAALALGCAGGGEEATSAADVRGESGRGTGVEPSGYDVAMADGDLLWEVALAAMDAFKPVDVDKQAGYIESALFGWKVGGGDLYGTWVVRLRPLGNGGWRFAVWCYDLRPIGVRSAAATGKDEWEVVGAHGQKQQEMARRIYESYLLRAASKGTPLPNEETLELPRRR